VKNKKYSGFKFTDEDFLEIAHYISTGYSWSKLARIYKCDRKTICKHFKEWKGIKVPEGSSTFNQLSEFAASYNGVSHLPGTADSDFFNNKRK